MNRRMLMKWMAAAPVYGVIAARSMSETLAAATGDVVRAIGHEYGRMPIALSGGCFQNARLSESIVSELAPCCTAYTHLKVPTGDGGISLGQAVVADAIGRTMLRA